MPRTAKANPSTLIRKSGSELLDESGELHDSVQVSQKTDQHKPSVEQSRQAQTRRLAAPSANDERGQDDSES